VVLEIDGEAVSVIVELREDDDGVQIQVVKAMVKRRPRVFPTTVSKCDWRLGP
jgi:hypothetical protein